MKSLKRKLGDLGERIAADYLVRKGYTILGHNYSRKFGEIDLIAKKSGGISFCEVKTRDIKNTDLFLPESSVNYKKMKNLRKICETYLFENNYAEDQEWQIDILTITLDKSLHKARIKHIRNAVFDANYRFG